MNHGSAEHESDPELDLTQDGLRVADHDGIAREPSDLPSGLVEVLTKRFTSVGTTNTDRLRHILITGIFKGWSNLPDDVRASDLWSNMVLFDHQMQRAGQGLVSRLATCVNATAMYQVSICPWVHLFDANAKDTRSI